MSVPVTRELTLQLLKQQLLKHTNKPSSVRVTPRVAVKEPALWLPKRNSVCICYIALQFHRLTTRRSTLSKTILMPLMVVLRNNALDLQALGSCSFWVCLLVLLENKSGLFQVILKACYKKYLTPLVCNSFLHQLHTLSVTKQSIRLILLVLITSRQQENTQSNLDKSRTSLIQNFCPFPSAARQKH